MTETEGFAAFYLSYPRKIARRDAEKAYKSLWRKGVKHEDIMSMLRERMSHDWKGRKPEYICYPATFLRAEDFTEEREELLHDDGYVEPKRKGRVSDSRLPEYFVCFACPVPHEWYGEEVPRTIQEANRPCQKAQLARLT